MLRLSLEQAELIEQLVLRRHSVGVAAQLAQAWPAVTERLKERWPAFVEAALQQGRKHGLAEVEDLARYASLWCLWGAAFEDKPGFEWAAEILGDAGRPPRLKVHQVVHRTRGELQRRQPAAASGASSAPAAMLTLAQFDAAQGAVDRQVGQLAATRAVFPALESRPAIKACDVGTVDMMVADIDPVQEYRHSAAGWQRANLPKPAAAPLHWSRAPEAPVELAVVSHALRAGQAARLNLKLQALAVCDARVHPEVVHTGAQGRLAWKGRDTARLSLALYALPEPVPDPKIGPPGIAAAPPPDMQRIEVASGGVRDAGAPFGALALAVSVYPATQWLTEVRHPAWLPMAWPAVADEAPPAAIVCRLEADGRARDASAWQRAWAGLQPAFRQGMELLFNAWSRVLDGQAVRLEVEASPLVGQAGLTWGYCRTDAATVLMRSEGALDLIASAIDLRLSGELVHAGARARIRLACKGRSELRMLLTQLGAQAVTGQGLNDAVRAWRFPFTLEVEPVASAELATLYAAPIAPALLGALAGECGLRLRPDGLGHQWFFTLRLEPVSVQLIVADPIVGGSTHAQGLLAAMTLVDWSAG